MSSLNVQHFCPSSPAEWRNWLEANHQTEQSVWLVYYRASSSKHNLSWSEAVDEALCFGWIDSTKRRLDDERFSQYFCRRKPSSTWSKINKDKIQKLTSAGAMSEAGFAVITTAKENGSWTILDDVENLIIPEDLERELSNHPGSMDFFLGLSKSGRKGLLAWIAMAKRDETKAKRIAEIVESAGNGMKPKHFR